MPVMVHAAHEITSQSLSCQTRVPAFTGSRERMYSTPNPDGLGLLQLTGPVPVLNVLPAVTGNQPGVWPIRTMAVDHTAVTDVIEVTRSQVETHAPGELDGAIDSLLMDQHLGVEKGSKGMSCTTRVRVPQVRGAWYPNSSAKRGL